MKTGEGEKPLALLSPSVKLAKNARLTAAAWKGGFSPSPDPIPSSPKLFNLLRVSVRTLGRSLPSRARRRPGRSPYLSRAREWGQGGVFLHAVPGGEEKNVLILPGLPAVPNQPIPAVVPPSCPSLARSSVAGAAAQVPRGLRPLGRRRHLPLPHPVNLPATSAR